MPYVICNDSYYVHRDAKGHYFLSEDIMGSIQWSKHSKAESVLNNSIKYQFKNFNLRVKYIESIIKAAAEMTTKQSCQTIESKPVSQPDEFDCDIFEKVDNFCKFVKLAETRKPYIANKIHELELEITDIEHAAEFYELNASQGYKIYKLLHDVRVQRRKLKDELEKINYIMESKIDIKDMEHLKNRIAGLDNRKYMPRINKELFGV